MEFSENIDYITQKSPESPTDLLFQTTFPDEHL
jgi:hypothetical protein